MGSLEASYNYPDPQAQRKLSSLIGIDDKRSQLEMGLRLVFNPTGLKTWSTTHYGTIIKPIELVLQRPPLFILAGDVGVGKTALAESIGDAVARSEKIAVSLYRLSLAARGTGLVGEMSKLIASAFEQVSSEASKFKLPNGTNRGGCILFIDEADALVQSRENEQMHHEDRAGVNSVIRGIDDISSAQIPVAIIMSTNRLNAIDPAIQRRASEIITFSRPTLQQRADILSHAFKGTTLTANEIKQLADRTGANGEAASFTFSDLTQRFIPRVILSSYPNDPVTYQIAERVLIGMEPTPKFRG